MTGSDASEAYASWLNDPEVNRYLATKSATLESVKEYIQKKNATPDTELYGIFLREGDKHIGSLKLEPIDRAAKRATLGILIGEKGEWGKGYAGEALRLAVARCFSELGMEEVWLGVIAQNTSAIRAYQKLGFVETARKPGSVVFPNGVFDQVEMQLNKKETKKLCVDALNA